MIEAPGVDPQTDQAPSAPLLNPHLQKVIRWAAWVFALCALAIGLANAALAFVYPMELELREGTGWLHVLAINAGVDIYDHSKVAFVNMNHGPLDPIVKAQIARWFPFLSSAMVMRVPVLMLPMVILAVTYLIIRRTSSRPILDSILWSMALYVALLGIHPYLLLVGRSDPMTISLLFVGLLFVYASAHRSGWRQLAVGACLGLALTASCLSCWRTASVAVVAVAANVAILRYRRNQTWLQIITYFAVAALAGLALFLFILGRYFHWDIRLYYQHFFGFFFSSGWPIAQAGFLQLIRALIGLRGLGALAVLLITAGAIRRWRAQSPAMRMEETWVLLALLFCAAITIFSIRQNITGGGIWYFAGFFCVLWFWAITRLQNSHHFDISRGIMVLILLLVANWSVPLEQACKLSESLPGAQQYVQKLREIDQQSGLLSEEFFFYKTKYTGQTIDMGDTVYAILKAKTWDPAFNATAQAYFDRLTTNPPQYVLTAATWTGASPQIRAMLMRRYQAAMGYNHILSFPDANQQSVVCVWQ